MAGDTVIAFDDGSQNPDDGQFLTSVLTYTAPADGSLLGEAITVRLTGAFQTNLDNVSLDATLVPAPAASALFGLAALGFRRRR